MTQPTYFIHWSHDDDAYVATTPAYKSLSWVAKDEVEALRGLKSLLYEVLADIDGAGE